MFYTERQKQIINHLETHENVSVQELSELLFASTSTIRRDLSELESIGILRRVHGGAVLTSGTNFDTPAPMRRVLQQTEKELIAQLASRFLSSSTNYFFDSSTTARHLVMKLVDYIDVRIATNGLGLLSVLSSSNNLDVLSCGGYLRSPYDEFTGTVAIQSIQNMSADYFFFSCAGFSLTQGATEFSDENVAVKQAFFQHSKKHILLCDHTKFGKEYFFKSLDLRDIDYVVTDQEPEDKTFIEVLGDRLIYPQD
ncbi:MAG: DeoR/GlpR transcriptional regulator [Lachnospiraceae bacterium]|nr:DeoR/GlpR transcriptional regulator [Lachnospiraceae bacterium]